MTCISLVEYAVVFGISASVHPEETAVHKLYCYPELRPQYEDSAIQNLCILSRRDLNGNNFQSFIHSFIITRENGSKFYGTSLTLCEPRNSLKTPDFISKCIVLISDHPFYTSLLQYLEDIRNFLFSPNPDLTLDSYLYNIVNEVRFPCTDNIINFKSPCKRTLYAVLPSNEDLPLIQLHYSELCKFLSPELLIKVITCILLEYNVFIMSEDPGKLNYFCESLASLIYPFTWNYPFVPILPSTSVEFLDAPFPCFIGWLSRGERKDLSDFTLSSLFCQIDITKSEVKFSDHDVPRLPFSEQISKKLTGLYNSFLNCVENPKVSQDQLSSLTELMSIVEVISNLNLDADVHADIEETGYSPESKHSDGVSVEEEYIAKLEFDCQLRELFYALFLNTFSDVGKFIIKSHLGSKSVTCTFDKIAYLSEKSTKDRDFLSQFFETLMFTKFVDDLIESTGSAGIDGCLDTDAVLFQYNLAQLSDTSEFAYPMGTFNSTCKRHIQGLRSCQLLADFVCPPPREVSSLPPPPGGYEGTLPDTMAIPDIAKMEISETHAPLPVADRNSPEMLSSPAQRYPSPTPAFVTTASELTKLLKEASNKIKQLITHHISLTLRHHYEPHTAELVSTPFMGIPAKYMQQPAVSSEDKGFISNFVEALERIWSHECRLSLDGSLLWYHILAYKLHCEVNSQYQLTAGSAVRQRSQRMMRSSSFSDVIWRDGLYAKASRRKSVGAVSNPFLQEVRHILEQENIMTDIGRVRMWVKLLLEKNVLKERIEEILSLHSHLSSSYNLSAFLLTKGELEQLLYHLDSLSCVEFSCFTHDFPLSHLSYSLTVTLARTLLKHTCGLWVLVSGSMGRSDVIKLDKGSNFCSFSCMNIGHVLGVRIGHDNGGINPAVFIQHIEVTNNLTGLSYFVRANRNLCDGQRDECVEYYFPANRFSARSAESKRTESGNMDCMEMSEANIRTRLQNVIRNVIHHFTDPRLAVQPLTYLVLGEGGLIPLLLELMLYQLLTPKHPYSQLWSLFSEMLSELRGSGVESDPVDKFLTTGIKLEAYNKRCGPAEKVKIFLAFSLSQGILHEWIRLMSESKLTHSFYKANSFFLNPELREFVFGAIGTLRSYHIAVDPLFTLYMD